MPGPLPDPQRRRRNAPTIPTTNLPIAGRQGRAPRPPRWLELGKAGTAWWRWAWKTPQACAWDPGDEVMIARRASLEDDLATIGRVENLDAVELLGAAEMADVRSMVQRLAALATGRLAICREIRELDDRLGLTPKGLAALRWKIVAAPEPVADVDDDVAELDEYRRRLTG